MNTKFTPGPWRASQHANLESHVFNIEGIMVPTIRGANVDQRFANARLIAAAPDLLAALRDVIGWVPGASAYHTDAPLKVVEAALAAIAKATGEPA